ncbi:MAG: T9SS type A sorting domain-containing protein [Ignavibacteria bacterium]|nr:T9SS type A sorting domain-containing protein [Ignavibacteria bacterium]
MNKLFKIFTFVFALSFIIGMNVNAQDAISLNPNSLPIHSNNDFGVNCSGGHIHDDGVAENGYGWNPSAGNPSGFATKFVPTTYPYKFTKFCVAWTRVASGPANHTFTIYQWQSVGGLPGPVMDSIVVTAVGVPVWTTVTIFDFDLPSTWAQVTSGDVYIGVMWNPVTVSGIYVGADQSTTTPLWPGYAKTATAAWTPIQTYFSGYRALLTRAEGGPATSYAHDYAAGPFLSLPTQFIKDSTYTIKSQISNLGTSNETNVPVAFFVAGSQQSSVNLSLTAGQTDSVSYSWTPTSAGSKELKVISRLSTDENKANDTVKTTVTVLNAPIVDIFCDPFTTTANWVITNDGGTCVWMQRSTPYPNTYTLPTTSVSPVLSADADACGSSTTTLTTATSITINCSAYENIKLHFDNDWNAIDAADFAKVDYSTNGGTTWTNLINWQGPTDVRNTHEVHAMPNATQMANVKVRFVSIQPGYDWWWAIDNVCLRGSPATGITQTGSNVPTEYALLQNYPNPFNPTTNIKFDIPEQGFVSLKVYDVVGKEVATLVNEVKSAGSYAVDFNGSNLSSGVYFYRLEVGSFTAVKRMILLK